MNQAFIFLVVTIHASAIVSQVPTQTNIKPIMEVLDGEHVLVDYSKSFNIPDFSKIETVVVIVEGGRFYGGATRYYEDSKDYQKLVKNEKLKAELNPCQTHTFCVRLYFKEDPTYVDSFQAEYVPETMEQVDSPVLHLHAK
eukprot:GFUD01099685.1.p1 GENE.GFUD01099685.1~~GFUD01099685.1.p1  ORF type:complete len:141 (+),score=34.53 GFUD01099685.1:2-424(+)